ncbi:hypothetical protein R1sor_005694 [Riccia sorocarpa]|uniref:Uncharacterized protein n=1 Tax=Riccia sorocarpa TaxID=122646 RepID=A0ABD3HK93_9MARC
MGSQSKRQRTVDRKRTDQLGQSSRRIAQANEDRLRLRRQRYAEQQAERRAGSSSEPVASGSQRGIRRKVMEIVDKLKSLSSESVEYESKILTRFLQHSSISKALKEKAIVFEHHWVWSDGAPTQFKNSNNFFFVAKYPSEHGGKSMIEYLTIGSTDQIKCVFWEVKETDGQFEACELQEWVTEWDFRSLVLSPTGVQSVHDITLADEFHAGADHEVLSDTLAVGNVFAVKGSSNEEAQTEYWLETHEQILMAISEVEAPIFERL